MPSLSDIYNVSSKGNLRTKAKDGFIRPTIKELFTSKDFEEVAAGPRTGYAYGGGYCIGTLGAYYLIAAPITGQTNLQWKTVNSTTVNTASLTDGYANTQAMITAGAGAHPAANFCNNLTLGGFTDWYLPAKDELSLLYTNHAVIELAGSGSFTEEYYWSSSGGADGAAWRQTFDSGVQYGFGPKDLVAVVRAIRRIAV